MKIETTPILKKPRGRPSEINRPLIVAQSSALEWRDPDNGSLYRVKVEGTFTAIKSLCQIVAQVTELTTTRP